MPWYKRVPQEEPKLKCGCYFPRTDNVWIWSIWGCPHCKKQYELRSVRRKGRFGKEVFGREWQLLERHRYLQDAIAHDANGKKLPPDRPQPCPSEKV